MPERLIFVNMIIGHNDIFSYFEKAIESDSLGHAYCFVGADGVGKRTVAKLLASRLLNVSADKLYFSPDYFYLERIEDEKTGKLKKDISIDQARDLHSRLQGKSWQGGYQVVIVDEIELLNKKSSNALLKTLEEPPSKTVFFLLTNDDNAMLPTIRSRCQLIFFPIVKNSEIVKGLLEKGISEMDAEICAALAWGRPGRAIELAEDSDKRSEYYKEIARLEKIISAPFYVQLKEVDDLFGDKTDHIRERAKLQKILELWMMLWRDVFLMKKNPERQVYAGIAELKRKTENFSSTQIVEIIDSLMEARILLGKNIHPRLLIEQILLKF